MAHGDSSCLLFELKLLAAGMVVKLVGIGCGSLVPSDPSLPRTKWAFRQAVLPRQRDRLAKRFFRPQHVEYMIAVLALAPLGAAATTAKPLYTNPDLARQLADSGASLILTTARSLTLVPARLNIPRSNTSSRSMRHRPLRRRRASVRSSIFSPGGAVPDVPIRPHDLVAPP
jgi:hypothetical protein